MSSIKNWDSIIQDKSYEELYQAFRERLFDELEKPKVEPAGKEIKEGMFTLKSPSEAFKRHIKENPELEAMIEKEQKAHARMNEMQIIAQKVSDYTTVRVEYLGRYNNANELQEIDIENYTIDGESGEGFEWFYVDGKPPYGTSPGDSYFILFGLLKYVEDEKEGYPEFEEHRGYDVEQPEWLKEQNAKAISDFIESVPDQSKAINELIKHIDNTLAPKLLQKGVRLSEVGKWPEDEYPATPDEAEKIKLHDVNDYLKKAIDEMFSENASWKYLAVGPKTWNILQEQGWAETKTDRGMIYLTLENMPEDKKERLHNQLIEEGKGFWNMDNVRLIKSSGFTDS